MLSVQQLKAMMNTTVSPDCLTDIDAIVIPQGDKLDRLEYFCKKLGNPYHFRVGKTAVSVEYGEKTLHRCLLSYIKVQD